LIFLSQTKTGTPRRNRMRWLSRLALVILCLSMLAGTPACAESAVTLIVRNELSFDIKVDYGEYTDGGSPTVINESGIIPAGEMRRVKTGILTRAGTSKAHVLVQIEDVETSTVFWEKTYTEREFANLENDGWVLRVNSSMLPTRTN
jgi:hypothetical protein